MDEHADQKPESPMRDVAVGGAALAADPHAFLRRVAARIAREVARNRPALISREVRRRFRQHPGSVCDLLTLMLEQFVEDDAPDDALVSAYFILLFHGLQSLRLGVERHFDWAGAVYRRFQVQLIDRVQAGACPPQLLSGILESIGDAGLELSVELLALYEEQIARFAPQVDLSVPGEIDAMFQGLVEEHGGEPFAIGETLAQMTRALPVEAQSALIGEFVRSDLPGMRDAVVLLALHPEEGVRWEALQWLKESPGLLTPVALRRLIVMRNWLPERERRPLDALIRSARLKGVECARWEPGCAPVALQASPVDGVGSQSLMVVVAPPRGKGRLGALLFRQGEGVGDAWITPPMGRRDALNTLRRAGRRELFLDVPESYLHMAVRHYLAVGLERESPPPAGLLRMAESMAATGWLPARVDFDGLLEEMVRELGHVDGGEARFVERTVRESALWSDIPELVTSWFEESQEVSLYLEGSRGRGGAERMLGVLERFCEPNRLEWGERLAWTAFWLRTHAVDGSRLAGLHGHFAVVAREILRGRPLYELPLMQSVARRTLAEAGWS